jgi:hypothetical protein
MGTANWNYLVEPFLFTYPGVTATEIEPWHEDGETWRRLAVTFPAELPNHNPRQTFYYGDDLLRDEAGIADRSFAPITLHTTAVTVSD